MRFAAPWDRMLRVLTTIAVLLLGAVATIAVIVAARFGGDGGGAVAAFVVAVCALTIVFGWALAPRGFSIEGSRLVVERPLRRVEVPLSAIRAAGPLPDDALARSVRVAGSGGFFGYYGRFWNRRLGAFRAYATRRRDLVHVDTADERFVLSPEPAARFLEALLGRAPAAARAAADAPIERRPMPRRTWVALGAIVAIVPLVLAAVLLATYAWTPRAATVADGEIRIERRLAAPVVIPLAEVRQVERLHPRYARGFWRVAGTALPSGVAFGKFRSRELGDFRLYAWRRGPYVLVDTAEERIVLTPDDPDAFVAAVRAATHR